MAQIITFNTLKAKNAVRNVAKALGFTFAEENDPVARENPKCPLHHPEDRCKRPKPLKDMNDGDERIRKVYRLRP